MATLTETVKAASGSARYPSTAGQTSRPGSGGQYGRDRSAHDAAHASALASVGGRGKITIGQPLPSAGGGMVGAMQRPIPIGSTSTQQTQPIGPAPTLGPLPEFQAPEEWTGRERAGEVQKAAGLGLKESRRSLREATAGLGNDPGSAYALRQALAQHGINVERTLLGARESAFQKEQVDMARKQRQAEIEYQSKINRQAMEFEAAYNKWMSTAKTTSTTRTDYDTQGNLMKKIGASIRVPGPGNSYFIRSW